MKHVIPISGKDSLATALIMLRDKPELPYEFFYNVTGSELPETNIWLDEIEKKLNISIKRVGANLIEIIEGFNFLPSQQKRYCTRMAKIEPMEALFNSPSYIYFGIRADEDWRAGYSGSANLIPIFPLKEKWMGIVDVYQLVQSKGLKPPTFFWQEMYDLVCNRIPKDWIDALPEWEFDMLFAGRSRPNCFHCFNQRQYEFIWLYLTHPELFDESTRLENNCGAKGYTWLRKMPLTKLVTKADKIMSRRADDIAAYLSAKNGYTYKSGFLTQGMFDAVEHNQLKHTSCGLLCGK